MENLFTAVGRTLSQLLDPAFLKVLFLGLITTVAAVGVTYLISSELMKEMPLYESGWQWWQDLVNDALGFIFHTTFFFTIMFFFVPISTIFVSIFLDDIVDAVEDKYYADKKAGSRLGLGRLAYLAMRLLLFILLLNILISPLYLLFFFWLPFVPMVIFYMLNSYLLGWGYYEMIAVRHLGIKGAGKHQKTIRLPIILAGFLTMVLFTIPIVNLTAPIIGLALICHVFHQSLAVGGIKRLEAGE